MIDKFQVGDTVSAVVVVKSIAKQKTKKLEDFIKLTINDGQNDISAFIWDIQVCRYDDGDEVQQNDIVLLKGHVGEFNNNRKIDVIKISKTEKSINLPSITKEEFENLKTRYSKLCKSITDEHFSSIIDSVNYNVFDDFIKAPAAKSNHQAHIGGLFKHSIEVAELCSSIHNSSPENLNYSLLITGALLHDIGKIKEYTYDKSFDRSTPGKLVGHTTLGIIIITKLLPDNVPPKKFAELVHLLLSHHGKKEWGAPIEPLMKEAVILHFSDMINSYCSRFDELKQRQNSEWSDFDTAYSRQWYFKSI